MDTIHEDTPQNQYGKLRRTDVPLEELRERYLSGESELSLAKHYGVARGSIRNRLVKLGVSLRTQTEANQLLAASRTPEDNKRNAEAANKAMRGRTIPFYEQCRIAKGRQEKQSNMSPAEIALRGWLENRGIIAIPQFAIGPYNADLAFNNIAIEIYGGGWHANGRHNARAQKRFDYIHGQGWNTIIIWIDNRRYPFSEAVVDSILLYIKEFQGVTGQCKVIGGDGIEFVVGTSLYKKALGVK